MGLFFTGRLAGNGVTQIGGATRTNTFAACFANSNGFLVLMCKASHVNFLLRVIRYFVVACNCTINVMVRIRPVSTKAKLFYGDF